MSIESIKTSSAVSSISKNLPQQDQKGLLGAHTISRLSPLDQNMDIDRASDRQGDGLFTCSVCTIFCAATVLTLLAPLCCGKNRIR